MFTPSLQLKLGVTLNTLHAGTWSQLLAGVDCHITKAEHHKVPSPIFCLEWKWKLYQCVAISFVLQHFSSLVSSVVLICCSQTFTLGFLLDTERGVASTPGYSGYVLGCFIYMELPLGNVAVKLDAFDTPNRCTQEELRGQFKCRTHIYQSSALVKPSPDESDKGHLWKKLQ